MEEGTFHKRTALDLGAVEAARRYAVSVLAVGIVQGS